MNRLMLSSNLILMALNLCRRRWLTVERMIKGEGTEKIIKKKYESHFQIEPTSCAMLQ